MKFPFSSAQKSAELPPATAEQILSNVLDACKREQSSVPLEALISYSNYRKERYSIQRSLILLMLALFLLLPFLFMTAGVRIAQINPGSGENPVYAITVDALFPIRQIEARLNGQAVPLYELTPGSYTASPRANGDMQISATLVNRQETTASIAVEQVDTAPPVLLSTEVGASSIRFFVEDAGCGVDYANISIVGEDGLHLSPLSTDHESGSIALPYPASTLHISIPDLRGNVLRVDLKPQP